MADTNDNKLTADGSRSTDIDTVADIGIHVGIHTVGPTHRCVDVGKAAATYIRIGIHATAASNRCIDIGDTAAAADRCIGIDAPGASDRGSDAQTVTGIDADAHAADRQTGLLRARRPQRRQDKAGRDE